jgi:hypothetical protein
VLETVHEPATNVKPDYGAHRFCRECGRKELDGSAVKCVACGTYFRNDAEPAKVEVRLLRRHALLLFCFIILFFHFIFHFSIILLYCLCRFSSEFQFHCIFDDSISNSTSVCLTCKAKPVVIPKVDTSKDNVLRAQSFQTYGKLSHQKKEEPPQVTISWANLEENLKCPTEVKVYACVK